MLQVYQPQPLQTSLISTNVLIPYHYHLTAQRQNDIVLIQLNNRTWKGGTSADNGRITNSLVVDKASSNFEICW